MKSSHGTPKPPHPQLKNGERKMLALKPYKSKRSLSVAIPQKRKETEVKQHQKHIKTKPSSYNSFAVFSLFLLPHRSTYLYWRFRVSCLRLDMVRWISSYLTHFSPACVVFPVALSVFALYDSAHSWGAHSIRRVRNSHVSLAAEAVYLMDCNGNNCVSSLCKKTAICFTAYYFPTLGSMRFEVMLKVEWNGVPWNTSIT